MRRTGIVAIVVTCALAGAFAAGPPTLSAAAVTVPPTVNATTWSDVPVPSAPGG